MLLWIMLGVIGILLLIIVVNILQNGPIIEARDHSINLDGVTEEDLRDKLSKRQVFQIFQSAHQPSVDELSGEFDAYNLPQGILSGLVNLITNYLFGPGKWVGKGFQADKMEGYNIFRTKNGEEVAQNFELIEGLSEIDGRATVRLDYRNLQSNLISGSMRDEVRKVNNNLFLGMGMTTWGLGSKNPA
ncbi:MAG: hypothetical protein ACXAE3_15285, partial [Candidatus Kariarchaeaceae archaeon]